MVRSAGRGFAHSNPSAVYEVEVTPTREVRERGQAEFREQLFGTPPEASLSVAATPIEPYVENPKANWRQRGACRVPGGLLDIFFSPSGREYDDERLARESTAKQICASCVVREECLDEALATREPHAILGGLTWNERRDILGIKRRGRKSA